MKNTVLFFSLFLLLSCKTKKIEAASFPPAVAVQDISNQKGLNYYLSQIDTKNSLYKSLYKGAIHLNIFALTDPHSSSNKSITAETEAFYTSYLISIRPDGDYYTKSALYKIEGLILPKILKVYEDTYPYFFIKIEYGTADERKTKAFKFKGVE